VAVAPIIGHGNGTRRIAKPSHRPLNTPQTELDAPPEWVKTQRPFTGYLRNRLN